MLDKPTEQGFRWPIPPHIQLRDFLPTKLHHGLLEWAMQQETGFRQARVYHGKTVVDTAMRIAATMRDIGPFQDAIEQRLLEALPQIRADTGIGGPMPHRMELELAAHGDGAHYKPHLDVIHGPDGKLLGKKDGEVRLMSAVYYFYNEPKAFSGGELRIYRMGVDPKETGDDPANYVDMEPMQNSLVVFPAWALHEVRPVHVPSGQFRDSRFALNCWFCASLGG